MLDIDNFKVDLGRPYFIYDMIELKYTRAHFNSVPNYVIRFRSNVFKHFSSLRIKTILLKEKRKKMNL